MNNILEERWGLALGRIQEIVREAGAGMAEKNPWRDYFVRTARFLQLAAESGAGWKEFTFEEKREGTLCYMKTFCLHTTGIPTETLYMQSNVWEITGVI